MYIYELPVAGPFLAAPPRVAGMRAAMESELCAACLSLAQALLSHPNPPKHHIIRKGTCPGLPGGISSLPGDQARILQGPENARIHPYPDARARTHTHRARKSWTCTSDKIRPDECNWTMEKQISGSWPNLVNVLSRIPLRRRGKEKWVGGAAGAGGAGRGKEGLATGGYVSASVMSVGIRLQETATGSLQDELKRESGKETVFVIATILQYSTQTCVETAAALS